MNLNEIINDLRYGELSSHGMFVSDLSDSDKLKLIAHINVALTELYTRFPLLTKELTLIQKSWICEYVLDNKHAVTNTGSTEPKYIYDTPNDPFTNDVIRVEAVYDEVGCSLLMNSNAQCKVALTPAMNVLEIPNPVDTNALFVIYRALHPEVNEVNDNLLLPLHLKPALLAYVAHRVYSGGSAQEHVMLSNSMLQKFELICVQQKEYGMTNQDDNDAFQNFCKNGWV